AHADSPRPLQDPRRRRGGRGGRGRYRRRRGVIRSKPQSSATDEAVAVHGLVKRYDEVEAVRGVDFDVRTGETFGFLGPNGAGKSTTINMLCTLVRPTAGAARVADRKST